MGLAACEQRRGAEPVAVSQYQALAADQSLTRVQRAVAFERLGDIAYNQLDVPLASRLYAEAEGYAFDEHRARAIAVKRYGLSNEAARKAIGELLVGSSRTGPDLVEASATLGQWSIQQPELGLADYLIGKNLYSRFRWESAREHLVRALQRTLPLPSVRREALRSSVFAACSLGDGASARAALGEYLADPALSSARKEGMRRFTELCRELQPQ
jgi:hypothetical protein